MTRDSDQSNLDNDTLCALDQIADAAKRNNFTFPVEYYDLKKHWRKVKRHIDHPEVQAILVRDFNKFTYGRWGQKFCHGMVPHQFESCDWWCDHKGRMPAFWAYTKHSACHWLCNFTLRLAQLVEPKRQWRIITSPAHSTVWDGERLLFDFNFLAMGISPKECFRLAYGEELKPNQLLPVHLAEHWKHEAARQTQKYRSSSDDTSHSRRPGQGCAEQAR